MDQIKIGKFIAECRKKKNLTQAQLAEKLNEPTEPYQNGRLEMQCPIPILCSTFVIFLELM